MLTTSSTPLVAFIDLDGTVTRDGSLFRGSSPVTLDAALALARLHEKQVEIVPCSGRTVGELRPTARLLGARAFIAELGSAIALEGGTSVLRVMPEAPDANALREAGVAEAVFKQFPLEWHTPWSETREHTLLLRGRVDVAPVRAFLAEVFPKLDLDVIDNGEVDDEGTRAYHVVPRGMGKHVAVQRFLDVRRLQRDVAVSFGDSAGDLAMASAVARHYWVGGRAAEGLAENVRVVEKRYGEGLLQAVMDVLERPALA